MSSSQNESIWGPSRFNTSVFGEAIPTESAGTIRNEYAAVLIKKRAFLGPVFFLNRRPADRDKVYANRIALFSGRRKREEQEDERKTARREVLEELGLAIPGKFDDELFEVRGHDDQGNPNHGYIYVKEFSMWDWRVDSRKMRKNIKGKEEAKLDRIGKVVKVKRWFFNVYTWGIFVPIDWTKFTPEAIYALVADLDVDRSRRPWTRATPVTQQTDDDA